MAAEFKAYIPNDEWSSEVAEAVINAFIEYVNFKQLGGNDDTNNK